MKNCKLCCHSRLFNRSPGVWALIPRVTVIVVDMTGLVVTRERR